ncbi:copper resistance CopC family protein [Spirillospora sp. CA-108201]
MGTAMCGLVMAPANPAHAHAELKSITPEHSTQTSAPAEAVLTFNQPVNMRFTVVKVTGSDGAGAGSGSPAVDGAVVRQSLMTLTRPGRYQVAYRTVSVDGHVISGSRTFVFRPSATGTATAPPATGQSGSPATAPAADRSERNSSSGLSWAVVIMIGLLGGLLVAAVLVLRRARRDH